MCMYVQRHVSREPRHERPWWSLLLPLTLLMSSPPGFCEKYSKAKSLGSFFLFLQSQAGKVPTAPGPKWGLGEWPQLGSS